MCQPPLKMVMLHTSTKSFQNLLGTQIWEDGSSYQGEFIEDMRHGRGLHKWANGEVQFDVF